jgi:hypothetical protein
MSETMKILQILAPGSAQWREAPGPAPAPGEPEASAELDSLPLGAREEYALRPTHRTYYCA